MRRIRNHWDAALRRLLSNLGVISLIMAAVLVVTFLVRQLVLDTQQDRVNSETRTFVTSFAGRLEAHVLVRLGVVEHLRRVWERGYIDNLDAFRDEAESVHDLFSDLQALNWVNPKGIVEVVTPLAGNEPALGLDITRLAVPAQTLDAARASGEMRMTQPITLAQGGTGFVAYIPLVQEARSLGFLNIVFRADPLVRSAMGTGLNDDFNIWILDSEIPMFGGPLPEGQHDNMIATDIEIGGRAWQILAEPTEAKIAASQSMVDETILSTGVLAALLMGGLSHLAASRRRSLRQSEERFAYAMKGANDGLWDWDLKSGNTYYSPRWFEMLGYAPGALPNSHDTFVSLLHPDDRQHVIDYPKTIIATRGEVLESEFRMRHKDGHWVSILSRAFLVRKENTVVRIVGTHVDITERREAEKAVRRAREVMREGIEALPVGFAYFDSDHRLLVFNRSYPRLLSVRDINLGTGMRFEEISGTSAEFLSKRNAAQPGDARNHGLKRWSVQRADGRWIEAIEHSTNSGGFVQVIEDITDARRHQERLRQTHKMEAIGQLTGGIAHDFNNLLAVIMGNAELLEQGADDAAALTSSIVSAARRGADLTQRLLAFSRKQSLHPEVVNLSDLIIGMQNMLERTLGEYIRIETVTPTHVWGALADPGQTENAILNLALNGRDAMPSGGTLTIECRNVTLSAPLESNGEEIAAGDYVALSVRDRGTGMSAPVKKQAFEPFFTTKDVGKGSGLGLSMVYGFAQQSGGQAVIDSVEGAGTTVTLFLPRATQQTDIVAPPPREAMPKGGGETVLVIEDEPAVRRLVGSMLERIGYSVISAESVAAARRIVETVDSIRLVLSDVVLPDGESGPEFAGELASLRPDLQVVFMSGYPASHVDRNSEPGLDGVLLNKPFGIDDLAKTLSRALQT